MTKIHAQFAQNHSWGTADGDVTVDGAEVTVTTADGEVIAQGYVGPRGGDSIGCWAGGTLANWAAGDRERVDALEAARDAVTGGGRHTSILEDTGDPEFAREVAEIEAWPDDRLRWLRDRWLRSR